MLSHWLWCGQGFLPFLQHQTFVVMLQVGHQSCFFRFRYFRINSLRKSLLLLGHGKFWRVSFHCAKEHIAEMPEPVKAAQIWDQGRQETARLDWVLVHTHVISRSCFCSDHSSRLSSVLGRRAQCTLVLLLVFFVFPSYAGSPHPLYPKDGVSKY